MSLLARIHRIPLLPTTLGRQFSVSSIRNLKEVREKQQGKELIVTAEYVKSPREDFLVPTVKECTESNVRFCPQCTLGLDIKHTDVLILSQYVRPDGCMLPSRVTGLCRKQQKKMSALVAMAQKAGLMINMTPSWSHKDPKKRFAHKKFNHYFDESTIKLPK